MIFGKITRMFFHKKYTLQTQFKVSILDIQKNLIWVKYDEYLLFLSFASTRIPKTFCKWIVVNFQLSYLRMTINREKKRNFFLISFRERGFFPATQTHYQRENSKIELTFSFWYAVTAINSVSLKTYVRNVE